MITVSVSPACLLKRAWQNPNDQGPALSIRNTGDQLSINALERVLTGKLA